MDLAGCYMRFYERCPVLTANERERASRLILCKRVAEYARAGPRLLGIDTVERM